MEEQREKQRLTVEKVEEEERAALERVEQQEELLNDLIDDIAVKNKIGIINEDNIISFLF